MTAIKSRYELLAELDGQESSATRREILRKVTEALDDVIPNDRNIEELDKLLCEIAADYCRPCAR